MRFPFPPAEPVANESAILAETSAQELDTSASGLEATVLTESQPDAVSIDVAAAADLPALTAEVASSNDLPEPAGAEVEATPDSIPESDPVAATTLAESAAPAHEVEPETPVRPRPRPKRKVIAFPRQPKTGENVHQLADPVLPEQPRILDVPEELEAYPTTPFLEGLQFEPATQGTSAAADRVELPFRAAGILRRMYAALVDGSLVLVATGVFGVIAHKMLPDLTLTKPVRLTAALVPLLLWAIFQYLLLVYAGKTAGMKVAGLRLRMFNGRQPNLRHRRNRAFGLYLSTASLAMGLLWAFVDVDSLCWHDRISGTYLTGLE